MAYGRMPCMNDCNHHIFSDSIYAMQCHWERSIGMRDVALIGVHLLPLVLDLLGLGVDLLLSLSLTSIKRHVDRDDSLVEDASVSKELLALKGLDSVLELDLVGVNLEVGGNLIPGEQKVRLSQKEKRNEESACKLNHQHLDLSRVADI